MILNLPYNAMRAFEAVVRLQGFGRAAQEMGVTQSAVSQHIKTLEEWTGRQLLIRGPKHTFPTREGELLADAITTGLGQISEICESLRAKKAKTQKITLNCPPGFAFNWLFPRLIRFDLAEPDLPVSISTNPGNTQLASSQEDLEIRYGMGGYSGFHVEKLMDERLFPVCAPSLLETGPALNSAKDLHNHTVLLDDLGHLEGNPPTWHFWAEETGQPPVKLSRTQKFGQANMVVQAAIEGRGVALGRETLVIDALHDGRLVRPFPEFTWSHFSYWFVCSKQALKSEAIQKFRKWLLAESITQKNTSDRLFKQS